MKLIATISAQIITVRYRGRSEIWLFIMLWLLLPLSVEAQSLDTLSTSEFHEFARARPSGVGSMARERLQTLSLAQDPFEYLKTKTILAIALHYQGKFDESAAELTWLNHPEYAEYEYPLAMVANLCVGMNQGRQGQYWEGFSSIDQSLQIARQYQDSTYIAKALGMQGIWLFQLGLQTEGMSRYEEAISILRIIGDQSNLQPLLTNLSVFYIQAGELAQAKAQLVENIRLQDSLPQQQLPMLSRANLAFCHLELGEYAAADTALKAAEAIMATIDYAIGEGYLRNLQAKSLQLQGQWAAARRWLLATDTLSIYGTNPDLASQRNYLWGLQLAQENDWSGALARLDQAKTGIVFGRVFPNFEAILLAEHKIAVERGRPALAIQVMEQLSARKDSLNAAQSKGYLRYLETRTMLRQREREVEELEQQIAIDRLNQRFYWLGIVGVLLLLGMALLLQRFRVMQRKNEQIATANRQLRDRNQELGELAYVVSHQLSERARTMSTHASLFRRKYAQVVDDRGKQTLGFLETSAKQTMQLLAELMTYVQIGRQVGLAKPVELQQAWERALGQHQADWEAAAGRWRGDSLPTLLAHPDLMQRIFSELIANAIRYRGERPVGIQLATWQEASEVIVQISDQGIGLDPAYQEKALEVFQQVHGPEVSGGGTGIGLAIVAKTMRFYHGRAQLIGQPEQGLTVRLIFPKKMLASQI